MIGRNLKILESKLKVTRVFPLFFIIYSVPKFRGVCNGIMDTGVRVKWLRVNGYFEFVVGGEEMMNRGKEDCEE